MFGEGALERTTDCTGAPGTCYSGAPDHFPTVGEAGVLPDGELDALAQRLGQLDGPQAKQWLGEVLFQPVSLLVPGGSASRVVGMLLEEDNDSLFSLLSVPMLCVAGLARPLGSWAATVTAVPASAVGILVWAGALRPPRQAGACVTGRPRVCRVPNLPVQFVARRCGVIPPRLACLVGVVRAGFLRAVPLVSPLVVLAPWSPFTLLSHEPVRWR